MVQTSNSESAVILGDRTLILRFDMRATAALESVYGMKAVDIAKLWQDENPATGGPRGILVEDLQRILWAGLRRHHADITLDAVLDLMDAALESNVPLEVITTDILAAYRHAQDQGEDVPKDAKTHPPAAAAVSAS